MLKILITVSMITAFGCNSEKHGTSENELWIYTSMYKDTINDLTPKLLKDFPGVKFNWYQAGSEEIATKVNAEILAGKLQADVLISSDRFWYEDLARSNRLVAHQGPRVSLIPESLKHPEGYYTTVSIPVMVLCYNSDSVRPTEAPQTFKELQEARWKEKFTMGSPLASGTNFTTMAMLQHHYGWDYFRKLKVNKTVSEGGNSSVIRRIQNNERPIGAVLLENILRFQDSDRRLQVVYPKDGVVTHANVMGIMRKGNDNRQLARRFADWMLEKEGQEAMVRSYMYSPMAEFSPPRGAPKLGEILNQAFPWTKEFLQTVTDKREELKETYTEIMFQ